MISEYLGRLKTWLKAKMAAAVRVFIPSAILAVRGAKKILVATKGNVLDMGKRYRLTSGHAPLFSLYTFFASR